MRPARRFAREGDAGRPPAESGALLAAMDRMREELKAGEMREVLGEHRHELA
jgi:hypothetical protein